MRLTIVAATGGIGRQLLRQALDAGHEVTAIARSPEKIKDQVPTAYADLAHPDVDELAAAVKGSDAILSGLGARTKFEEGVATRGTEALIGAARKAGVRRLVVVSAAPIGTVPSPARPHPPRHDPGEGFFMRHLGTPFAKTMFRTHYEDLARMEDAVRESGLDWTVSRPPKLTDKPLTGRYRTAIDRNVRGGFSISRADVAHHMLACLSRPETIGHTVGIAS
ncbi:NAD(P)-dependent oxidoreductase [Actinoplanes sp. CA-030573]|uniref:NAD(P)-dependent oxidoreductase n=1 Tax=Actinoplanes sp. CA-030573 TaxID=3239898 RepID=UPI003D9126DD